ncbi:CPBP family glutamic-type intramembrane protease [Clostridium sp. JNZ J1-5]
MQLVDLHLQLWEPFFQKKSGKVESYIQLIKEIFTVKQSVKYYIVIFAMSFMLGAIYKVSYSLWLCVLFHAMINAYLQVWVDSDNIINPLVSTYSSAVFKIIVAIVIVEVRNHLIKTKALSV